MLKKQIIIILVLLILAVSAVFIFLLQPKSTLKQITDYETPVQEYAAPEFITENLPFGFSSGTAQSKEMVYQDGTVVEMRQMIFTKGLESVITVQILDIAGEKLIENTVNVDEYVFEAEIILDKTVIAYNKDNLYGYIWNHGKYSLMVFGSSSIDEPPSYLLDFARIYLTLYPSTM